MIKKILSMLVILSMVFFVQCTDDPFDPVQESYKAKGGNGGGGGGGHTETAGNNLSFPALLADGYAVTPIETDMFTVPYIGDYPGIEDQATIDWLIANGPWYAQKTEGNLWQADYLAVTSVDINWIDWGDAIEAVDPKVRRPYRLELVLYVNDLATYLGEGITTMEAFPMAELEYPSSKDEQQGTNSPTAGTYQSSVASVASTKGEIVVQRYECDPSELTWDGTKWAGALPPVPIAFSVENNVGGKLIFGASLKGWKPTVAGEYRITFYMPSSTVNLGTASVGNYNGSGFDPVTPETAENNCPVVESGFLDNGEAYSITYVDVTAGEGGGGGGE